MKGNSRSLHHHSPWRRQLAALSALWLLLVSCKQTTPPPTQQPTPAPSVRTTAPPLIRTAEIAVDFAQPVPTEEQPNSLFTPRGVTINEKQASAQLMGKPLAVTVEQPAPFLALSAKWAAMISPEAKFTLSVRVTTDQEHWSEWQRSSLDGDPRTQAGLFFFAAESKFIQYRIEMQSDNEQHAPLLQSLKLRFISPGATPEPATTGSFLRRAQWDVPPSSFQSKRQTARIQHVIVHHTATANDVEDWPAVVRTIWNFHAVTNGWRDLGYHYLIDPRGVIYEGRAGGEGAAGIHFSCANTGTMGIAMLGNFMAQPPTDAALTSLKKLLAQKMGELKLEPTQASFHPSTGLLLPHIAGHRDANASKFGHVCAGTHCPGDALYALLPTLRADVKVFGATMARGR